MKSSSKICSTSTPKKTEGLRGQGVFNWLHYLGLSHHFDVFMDAGFDTPEACMTIGECELMAMGIRDGQERLGLLQGVRLLTYQAQEQMQKSHLMMLYNNNAYINPSYPPEEGDYSECAEFDLSGGKCDGSGCGGVEPYYECVHLPPKPGGDGKVKSLRLQLRDHVKSDGINFSRVRNSFHTKESILTILSSNSNKLITA